MMKPHYNFQEFDDGRAFLPDRRLFCPNCKETLEQADIETYSKCPFCDYQFELNSQLEDFILEPIVERWVRQQNQIAIGHRNMMHDFWQEF